MRPSMNLFATDPDWKVAATHLDDIRLNKMITESCQMIVTALVKHGLSKHMIPLTKAGTPYKTKGHANHPITLWTARSFSNFFWHLNYLACMLEEYKFRTGKDRAGHDIVQLARSYGPLLILNGGLTPFYNASAYIPNSWLSIHGCYRKTLVDKWTHDKIKVKWTKRQPPIWAIRTIQIGDTWYKFTPSDEESLDQCLLGEHRQS